MGGGGGRGNFLGTRGSGYTITTLGELSSYSMRGIHNYAVIDIDGRQVAVLSKFPKEKGSTSFDSHLGTLLDGHVSMIGAGLSASRLLPKLKGRSLAHVEKILTANNFAVETNPKKLQPFGGKMWKHADGSTVTVHPYGNGKVKEVKGGRNAHVHKVEPIDRKLNDRGARDRNKDRTHIGIRNPRDYKEVMRTPHGSGKPKNTLKPVDPLQGKTSGGNLGPRTVGNTIRASGRSGGGALGGGGVDIDEITKGTPHSKKKSH